MNSIEKLAVSVGAIDMVRFYLGKVRAGSMTAADAMAEIEKVLTTWERATGNRSIRGQA